MSGYIGVHHPSAQLPSAQALDEPVAMASALAAFAYGLTAGYKQDKTAKKAAEQEADDAELVESEDEAGPSGVGAAAPSSLATFAKQQHEANQQAGLSLVHVAKAQQSGKSSTQTLETIAAQVNEEEAAAAKARSEKTESALQAASEHVRAQAQAKQRQAIEQAVQQAMTEEQQEYQQDEFEEEEQDPVIRQAASMLIDRSIESKAGNKSAGHTRSVDRQGIQRQQNHHGLQRRPATNAATMKDKLSTFQFCQLSLTQRRVFLATLAEDNDRGSAGGKPRRCNMVRLILMSSDVYADELNSRLCAAYV